MALKASNHVISLIMVLEVAPISSIVASVVVVVLKSILAPVVVSALNGVRKIRETIISLLFSITTRSASQSLTKSRAFSSIAPHISQSNGLRR